MKNLILLCFFAATAASFWPSLTSARPLRSTANDLLSALFRQTIYNRIENLLLDPGKRANEKHQKIIESAVDNYHRQKMILPVTTSDLDLTDLTGKVYSIAKLFLQRKSLT